jgi:hypothetical protein
MRRRRPGWLSLEASLGRRDGYMLLLLLARDFNLHVRGQRWGPKSENKSEKIDCEPTLSFERRQSREI